MKKINLIGRSNGVGLDRDVQLLSKALAAYDCEISYSHSRSRPWWRRLIKEEKPYDINIYIERIFPRWFGSAKRSLLIPNQERFPLRHIHRLAAMDLILCKTQAAVDAFAPHHPHCVKSGFYSLDLKQNDIKKTKAFLHLAGASLVKGTQEVVELWRARPDYPPLTIVQHSAESRREGNITWLGGYQDQARIIELQNSHQFHLCASQCEGWGHYIVEAMSTNAVVITTDAAPMNELINPSRGALVKSIEVQPRHMGHSYKISSAELGVSIDALLTLDSHQLDQLAEKSRLFFETLEPNFIASLIRACELEGCISNA